MSEIAAVEWLSEHMHRDYISPLGMQWLRHARQHLEDRIEAELRQKK